MSEANLIRAALQSREAYDKVRHHVDMSELSPQAKTWWPMIEEWYTRDPAAKAVDVDALKARGSRHLPEKHLETLIGYLDTLPPEVSANNVVSDLLDVKRFSIGNQLCAAIQSRDASKIEPVLQEYQELLRADSLGRSEIRWTEDDDEMQDRLNRENLIKVAPKALNDKLKGGAAKGDHIVVFGRPEAFKSGFTCNMVAGFLKFNHKVLYIGNEEDTYKTRKRIICNLANCTQDQFEEDTDKALELAKGRGLDKLRICHLNPGTIPEIEELCREVRPDILVLDQIRNIEAKGDGMTQKLERLGIQVRALLGRYDMLGVSVTQARDAEHAGPWLSMEELDSSRTGLPGQADVIIGVGATPDLVAQNQRAISLCKNKLNDEADGRVGFMVHIDMARTKVR